MTHLKLSDIRIDGDTQTRERLCKDTIEDYAEAYKRGDKMPPLIVFDDGDVYWLSDGFHRFNGAKKSGLDKIDVDVRKGSAWDAFKFGVLANVTHGLRRTNADKRYAVERILDSDEADDMTQEKIAEMAGVSKNMVSSVVKERNYLASKSSPPKSQKKSSDDISLPLGGASSTTYEEYDASEFEEEEEADPMQITVDECSSVHREAKAKVNEARRLMEGLAESHAYLRDVIGRLKRDLKQASTCIHQMEPQDYDGDVILTRADIQSKG